MKDLEQKVEELQNKVKQNEVTKFQKLIFVAIFCCSVALIGSYISYLMGSEYFFLDDLAPSDHIALDWIVSCVLFIINIVFWVGIGLDLSPKQMLLCGLYYAPVWLLSNLFLEDYILITCVFPIVYGIMLSSISKKSAPDSLKRFLFAFSIGLVYQIIAFQVKTNTALISHTGDIGIISKIYYSIDFNILLLILYLKKGGRINASMEYHFRAHEEIPSHQSKEDQEADEEFKSYQGREKAAILAIILGIQIFQLFIVLAVSLIGNVLIEVLIILPCFWLSRYMLKRSWHSDSIFICTVVSAILFYLGVKASIPFNISIFCPVVIGILIAYSLYIAAVKFDHYYALQRFQKFNVKTCTHDELLERCQLIGLSDSDIHFCVNMFIDKMPAKEAADYFHMEYQSVKNKKFKLSKQLNSTL